MTANAGEIKSVVLEVRVANGKLYSFGTDGWYSDINANIKV